MATLDHPECEYCTIVDGVTIGTIRIPDGYWIDICVQCGDVRTMHSIRHPHQCGSRRVCPGFELVRDEGFED